MASDWQPRERPARCASSAQRHHATERESMHPSLQAVLDEYRAARAEKRLYEALERFCAENAED
jgi:hypothetical protein